jgi:DNA-binding LytR/AlgR family response regulator
MLKIAICDDELFYCTKIKQMISCYCESKNITYEIHLFSSGEQLMESESERKRYDIIYLDIDMHGMNGIATAQHLRQLSSDTFLVFVTAFIDYTLEGYKVEAIRYILKDTHNFAENIYESLDAILEKLHKKSFVYEFSFKEGVRKLCAEQIVFIESNLHTLSFLVLADSKEKIYTLNAKLDEIQDLLPKELFARIHQSYLVHLKYMKRVSNYQATLWNEKVLPISRPRYKDIREQFLLYEGEF